MLLARIAKEDILYQATTSIRMAGIGIARHAGRRDKEVLGL